MDFEECSRLAQLQEDFEECNLSHRDLQREEVTRKIPHALLQEVVGECIQRDSREKLLAVPS